MSKLDMCINCKHNVCVGDGYCLCTRDAIPVTVIDDYEPTKYFCHCLEVKDEDRISNV